jgi:hypothetical protein
MRVSSLVGAIGALAVTIGVASVAGQSAKYNPPRTPDGKPDLQGNFTFATITPLQRPDALKDKDILTPEEAAAFETAENTRLNRDLYTPEKGQPSAGYPPQSQGGVLSYNDFWYERGDKLTEDRRSSLITDPPDGRIPYSAAYRARMAERARRSEADMYDDPEALSLVDRCILGFNAGPPMISGTYNNNLQIVQTPGYIVIYNEMVHNARIIPTDGRPHGTVPMWTGDSRGHWEGDTLVVETLNFRRETSLPGSMAQTKVVERFTRIGPRTIDYKFTITDPTSYTRSWTASEPLRAIDEQLFEYACHEANYGMEGVLRGARFREKNPPPKK